MTERDNPLEEQLAQLKARLAGSEATDPVTHLGRAVAGVDDPVLSHEACEAHLPTYVDEEVAGLNVAELHPDVKRHLDLCESCAAMYLALLDVALAEVEGKIPQTEAVPAPDLSFLPPASFVDLAKDNVLTIATSILNSLSPAGLEELDIFGDVFFERIAEVGRDFRLTPQSASALGFGSEGAPMWLRALAATYETTRRLAERYSPADIQARLDRGEWIETVDAVARQVGREMLGSNQAAAFAWHYQAALPDQPGLWPLLSKTLHSGR